MLKHYTSREKLEPRQNIWIRTTGPVPADRAIQAAVLAYLSDMTLLDTSTFAHGRAIFDPDIQAASLDHAMWFHRPHPLDGWLLYTQDSPSTQGGRGFTRGAIYARGRHADRLGGAGRADPAEASAYLIGNFQKLPNYLGICPAAIASA